VREMEDRRPSSVGLRGWALNRPDAALAEDRRGERSGRRPGLTRSGGDQEGVPEHLAGVHLGWVSSLKRRKDTDGIETGGPRLALGISLAGAR
jgi:hypothetical protein